MNVLYDLEYLDLRAAGHHWITWESIHPESFPRFGDLARTWMDLILFEQVKQQGVDALFLSKSISPVWNHEALCFYQGWKVFARKHEPKTCVFSWCNDELRRAVTWMPFPSPWKCCRPALPPPLAVEKGGETTDSPSNHGVFHTGGDNAQTGWFDTWIPMAPNWGPGFWETLNSWSHFQRQIFWMRFFWLYSFLPTQITI